MILKSISYASPFSDTMFYLYIFNRIWATPRENVYSNMRNTRRFRSSCACAKYHPGLCSPFIHSVLSKEYVSEQWRPWSDCAFAQSDLGLRSPHMPEDKFSQGAANLILIREGGNYRHILCTTGEIYFINSFKRKFIKLIALKTLHWKCGEVSFSSLRITYNKAYNFLTTCVRKLISLYTALTFTTLWANAADDVLTVFSQKTLYHISCKLSLRETIAWNVKSYFLDKNKKKYFKISSAEFVTQCVKH